MKNILYEYLKKNPDRKKKHIAADLGMSPQSLSYWAKQKGERFTVELSDKIKGLK